MLVMRLIQIGCVVALIAVLYAFKVGFISVAGLVDDPGSFAAGFILALLLACGVWLLSEKLEGSSRSRDTSSKE